MKKGTGTASLPWSLFTCLPPNIFQAFRHAQLESSWTILTDLVSTKTSFWATVWTAPSCCTAIAQAVPSGRFFDADLKSDLLPKPLLVWHLRIFPVALTTPGIIFLALPSFPSRKAWGFLHNDWLPEGLASEKKLVRDKDMKRDAQRQALVLSGLFFPLGPPEQEVLLWVSLPCAREMISCPHSHQSLTGEKDNRLGSTS